MIEFIAHTAPEDNIPSKNQHTHNGVPNKVNVGEKIDKDRNQPPWNPKHMGHDKIPEINSPTGLNG
jgi:hypothetical protein